MEFWVGMVVFPFVVEQIHKAVLACGSMVRSVFRCVVFALLGENYTRDAKFVI
jgi:hypothetical protein